MCKAKVTIVHDTFKSMEVVFNKRFITIDFDDFEIKSKKKIKVRVRGGEMINFFLIEPAQEADQEYLDYLLKRYELIAAEQIVAQKTAEKQLSQRRVRIRA